MDSILITGGAGYIGSHTVEKALKNDMKIIVLDNLITGNIESLPKDVIFYNGDINDSLILNKIFQENKIKYVIHFAASSLVQESNINPFKYYRNNIIGTQNLLECMIKNNVYNIVLSSTAAVYGDTNKFPIKESFSKNPGNVYGETKFAIEKMLDWCQKAYGLRYVILRYFNAAGASDTSNIGEYHNPETHLIPLVLSVAQGKKSHLEVFGDDYKTDDGTCIRDFVHVKDLAEAHIKAVQYLSDVNNKSDIFNLGTGKGISILKIIESSQKITRKKINIKYLERRTGDPAILVADYSKARKILNWTPENSSIDKIITDAWNWHNNNPEGFK